mgnify:CR=1 FL=1
MRNNSTWWLHPILELNGSKTPELFHIQFQIQGNFQSLDVTLIFLNKELSLLIKLYFFT